jgi:peptidoglycan/LPS O-acetylase OafA/YrhL
MMKYYPKINGLRCIAISLVLLQHFAKYIANPLYAGFYGVDLFFVISGFLVTTVLLRSNKASFKENYTRFLGRRTLRIFPIYYLTILIFWLSGLTVVRENLVYLLTYTFNYAMKFKGLERSAINPFWSLCVEEQFYLFWPFFVLLLKRKTTVLFMATLLVILIGYAQQVFVIFPSLRQYNYVSLLTRMAPLGLGAIGAIAANKNVLPGKLFTNKWFEYFVFFLLVTTLVTTYQFKLPVLGLCSLYLVIKAALYNFSFKAFDRFVSNKKVMYIGIISYGIYVFHMPVLYFLTTYVVGPFWAAINFDSLGWFQKLRWHVWIIKLPLYSLVSIGVAAFSFKYIETPILSLKDRYFR